MRFPPDRRVRSLPLFLSLTIAAGCGSEPGGAGGGNPLATADQQALDARLVDIAGTQDFRAERALLRAQLVAGHGLLMSAEARARLDNAVDELVGGAIAEGVNGDAAHPKVYWIAAAPHRWFGLDVPGTRWAYDNPDNAYRTIPIDPAGRYRVHGRRRGDGPADMSFSLIDDTVTQGTLAYLDGKTLQIGKDGRYEISVDADPADGRPNHLQSAEGAVQLFIRSNLGDWAREAHDALQVERLDAPAGAVEPSDAEVAASASSFLLKAGPVYGLALLGLKTMLAPVSSFPAPSTTQTPGALVTQANSFGHFKLADDEALVLTLDPGGAGYFVVPVTDPWMLGVDPGRHQSSLNQAQAVPDADGRYTFVVAPQDPGVRNWLDTAGLHEGTMMIRWQRLPEGGGTPALATRLVKLAGLAEALPAGTAYVTPDERRAQLAARLAAYEQRFRTDAD